MPLNLIPKASIDLKQKCKTCIQAKQPRKGFTTYIEEKLTCLNWFLVMYVIVMMCYHVVVRDTLLLSLMISSNIAMCI